METKKTKHAGSKHYNPFQHFYAFGLLAVAQFALLKFAKLLAAATRAALFQTWGFPGEIRKSRQPRFLSGNNLELDRDDNLQW